MVRSTTTATTMWLKKVDVKPGALLMIKDTEISVGGEYRNCGTILLVLDEPSIYPGATKRWRYPWCARVLCEGKIEMLRFKDGDEALRLLASALGGGS